MKSASSSPTAAGSSSSASTEEREAAANNQPRRKRRRIATGHGIQQIPETSAVLLPPQRQGQPTLSPIEQRHVAEHQTATASFAGAELTETDYPEPVAAFVEVPAADEPMERVAGPAAEEIPLENIIANFLPHHQKKIRESLNDEDVQQILNAVRNFLTLLRESGIKLSLGQGRIPTPSLFGRLRYPVSYTHLTLSTKRIV